MFTTDLRNDPPGSGGCCCRVRFPTHYGCTTENSGRFGSPPTGARKVNLVGHSEGSTVSVYYMKFLGGVSSRQVRRVRNQLQGDDPVWADCTGDAARNRRRYSNRGMWCLRDFAPDSPFIRKLNAGGSPQCEVRTTQMSPRKTMRLSFHTRADRCPGAERHECDYAKAVPTDLAGHLAMAIDPNIAKLSSTTSELAGRRR